MSNEESTDGLGNAAAASKPVEPSVEKGRIDETSPQQTLPHDNAVKKFGAPMLVLAAVFTGMDTIIETFRELNAIRDRVIMAKPGSADKLEYGQAWVLVWHDWLPFSIGILVFLVILCAMLWSLPRFVVFHDEGLNKSLRVLRNFALLLPGYAFLGWLVVGYFDWAERGCPDRR